MVKITYLGHASFKIEDDKLSFVLDPYQHGSVPNLRFPDGIEANHIYCSHEHQDHNARNLIKITSNQYYLDFEDHSLPHDKQSGKERGYVIGRIFKLSGLKIAHLGDIGDISDENRLKPFKGVDVLMVPINGFYTISAQDSFDLFNLLKPRLIIPMHYEIKKNKSGYPDNGQFDIFKKLFTDIKVIKGNNIVLDEEIFAHQALIFEGND